VSRPSAASAFVPDHADHHDDSHARIGSTPRRLANDVARYRTESGGDGCRFGSSHSRCAITPMPTQDSLAIVEYRGSNSAQRRHDIRQDESASAQPATRTSRLRVTTPLPAGRSKAIRGAVGYESSLQQRDDDRNHSADAPGRVLGRCRSFFGRVFAFPEQECANSNECARSCKEAPPPVSSQSLHTLEPLVEKERGHTAATTTGSRLVAIAAQAQSALRTFRYYADITPLEKPGTFFRAQLASPDGRRLYSLAPYGKIRTSVASLSLA